MPKNPYLDRWTQYGTKHLAGRKIIAVRYMTAKEMEGLGWSRSALVLQLDNGTIIYPSQDDEGNGPGSLFGQTNGAGRRAEQLTFPVI
jgi:hypothetical protein